MKDKTCDVSISVHILTAPDSCAPLYGSGAYCEIDIETADAGGGFYPVIKSERFACDSPDQLSKVVAAVMDCRAELDRRLRQVLIGEHTPKENDRDRQDV